MGGKNLAVIYPKSSENARKLERKGKICSDIYPKDRRNGQKLDIEGAF